ncbi:MAG: hypothetical protein N5P05_003196 [Chroococcopsis gigantea SAG 12.99]|nr:hypothetical protein [Chroococcopsis gigantea SAG 12.99]
MTYYYNGTSWGDYLNYRSIPFLQRPAGNQFPAS